jgi:hypothetical protein
VKVVLVAMLEEKKMTLKHRVTQTDERKEEPLFTISAQEYVL